MWLICDCCKWTYGGHIFLASFLVSLLLVSGLKSLDFFDDIVFYVDGKYTLEGCVAQTPRS
jgi:hypothetical protein